MHFILQAASTLAAFAHPSHVFIYAPGDSFSCRLDATRMILCIGPLKPAVLYQLKRNGKT
ncbi:hypothetical protein DN619_08745 [Klebsiella michiganensis]|nr:hypothetical protein AM394_26705 [Klebsiella oxytoca]AUW11082.1 hypothetical protein C2U42_18440 [Klebsiella oxytoca]MBW5960773.1 hypothetical protein [Klebsiella michiganensis]RWT46187.1 hypothetical protein DN619_08745 [Klebsiella michiganensis]